MYSRSTKTLFAVPSYSEDFEACVGYCTPLPSWFSISLIWMLSQWRSNWCRAKPISLRLEGRKTWRCCDMSYQQVPHYIFAHLWYNKDHGIWTPNIYCTFTLLDLHHAECYMSNLQCSCWLKLAVMAFFLAGLARSRALHLARARCWGPTARCFSSALPEPLKQRGVEELRFWICIVVFNVFLFDFQS